MGQANKHESFIILEEIAWISALSFICTTSIFILFLVFKAALGILTFEKEIPRLQKKIYTNINIKLTSCTSYPKCYEY